MNTSIEIYWTSSIVFSKKYRIPAIIVVTRLNSNVNPIKLAIAALLLKLN